MAAGPEVVACPICVAALSIQTKVKLVMDKPRGRSYPSIRYGCNCFLKSLCFVYFQFASWAQFAGRTFLEYTICGIFLAVDFLPSCLLPVLFSRYPSSVLCCMRCTKIVLCVWCPRKRWSYRLPGYSFVCISPNEGHSSHLHISSHSERHHLSSVHAQLICIA